MKQTSTANPVRIYLNQRLADPHLRQALFAGDIFIFSSLATTQAICDFALQIAREKFETDDPRTAYHHMPVEEFAKRAEGTKNFFTNCTKAKELLRDFARELGIDTTRYYFDVPRIRIVPNYDYLHAGVSYAYAPHRDPWYGGPEYQINFWMPAVPITPDETMAIYPAYFSRPVKNTSSDFDLVRWDKIDRPSAVANITAENRVHPLPLEEIDCSAEVRFAGAPGNVMMFCGHHLHATIPNRSDRVRFSVDFRFYNVDDIEATPAAVKAPVNIDSAATGQSYGIDGLFNIETFETYGQARRRR